MAKPYTKDFLDSLVGTKINKVTILSHFKKGKNNCNYFECLCECGRVSQIRANHLLNENQETCGKHHKKYYDSEIGTRIYNTWNRMMHRCYDINNQKYYAYGARGILICNEWKNDYNAFYEWSIKNGYQIGLWIERIDNDGDYRPENCRWATRKEQMNNTRRNHFVQYREENKTIAQWCEILDLPYKTINSRLNRGYTPEQAFETPIRSTHK